MTQTNLTMVDEKAKHLGLFSNGSLFRVGVLIWILVIVFGYMEFRISGEMLYDSGQTVPAMLPKGTDYKSVYNYGVALESSLEEYLKLPNVYPPFVTVVLLPLTVFPSHVAYEIFALLIACSLFIMIYACLREHGEYLSRNNVALLSLVVAALLLQTYPVNFALERGNNDIVAAAFAALGLLALSRNAWLRAVILLAIAVQFKIYFAILAILLLRSGKKAIGYFVLLNLVFLMVLGIAGLEKFVTSVIHFANGPFVWAGNHSLYSFISNIGQAGSFDATIVSRVRRVLYLPFLASFFFIALRYYREVMQRRSNGIVTAIGFNSREIGLIGICFGLMSLVFSTSHDYKLTIHMVPFLLLLTRNWTEVFVSKREGYMVVAVISVGMAFLFLPRFNLLPQGWFSFAGNVPEMKTPGILLAYMGYLYLALKGNTGFTDTESSRNTQKKYQASGV